MVVTHSVRVADDVAGIRWYQLSSLGGADWTMADQGTYAPSPTKSRWMGSAAMDRAGNVAVGYSLSGAGIHPSIAIAGRLSGDPAGQLTQAERKVFAGPGSQVPDLFASGRWGDYSDMTVGTNGCAFFYTTMYYERSNAYRWATRVVRFSFPSCVKS